MNTDTQENDIYSGVRWSAVATYGSQAVQLITTLVLARLLAPEYFGLLAMAQVFVGFAGTFSSMGFSQAIVQRKQITEELLSSLFYVTLAVGCLITITLACTSPAFTWIYSNAEVAPIIATLSLIFILQAPCLVPTALLTRRMAFNRLAVIDITVAILNASAAITLAWFGWGVWALVWPTVATPLIRTPMVYLASRWRPRLLFRWSEVRSVMGFGANLTGFSIFNYFARNADNFIIGAFLGPVALGYYHLAYKIMLFPRDAVTNVLTRVLFPTLSRMQDDDDRLKAVYLRSIGAIAFVTFPMMAGLAMVARPFVEVVLGEKWLPVIPLILLLIPVGALQSVWAPTGQVLLAKGRADWYFWQGTLRGCLFVASFLIGLPWEVFGIAFAYALTCVAWTPIHFWITTRHIQSLSMREILQTLFTYLLLTIVMVGTVSVSGFALHAVGLADRAILASCVALGVAVYTLLALLIRPPATKDLFRLAPKPVSAFIIRRISPRIM